MQPALTSGWASWAEICTDRWRAAAFSSWPPPSGQLKSGSEGGENGATQVICVAVFLILLLEATSRVKNRTDHRIRTAA